VTRLLAVVTLLFCVLSQAHAGSVHIVLSEQNAAYQQAADNIQSALSQQGFNDPTQVSTLTDFTGQSLADDDLIVSVGASASQQLARNYPQHQHLFSYLDKSALPAVEPERWEAVLVDQPLQRLVDTSLDIVRQRPGNTLIIAVSASNSTARKDIAELKLPDEITLQELVIDEGAEPAKIIDKALFNAGALIALRDKHIWSGENAKWMLYQSYKYNVPVIGYSKSFLKAGALVSVYAGLTETASATARRIVNWHTQQGYTPGERIHYPRYSVEYNKNIARALKITIPEGGQTNVRD
jgi:ABC-type uncharacterized transport system substrate-binding protein